MKLNFTYGKIQRIMLLFILIGLSKQGRAADYYIKTALTGTAIAPLAWNTASNWAIGSAGGTAATVAPTSIDNVFILLGKYVSIPLGATGNCNTLNVVGTTANLYIQGSSTLNCVTVNINTGGNITMVTLANNVCRINCSDIINVGIGGNTTATGKGTLTVVPTSQVTMNKLVIGAGTIGNASTIGGRTGTAIFKFTGSGLDVIPFIAAPTTNIPTTPIFGNVKFNSSGTITIPSGFSAKVMSIDSGTVDFGSNYSLVYTSNLNTSLSMLGSTNLIIGGSNQFPNIASLVLDPSSTIIYNGNDQMIKALSATYKNLTLSGGIEGTVATKTLEAGITVDNTLKVDDYTTFDLNGQNLTIWGNYINGIYTGTAPNMVYTKGSGCIRSSSLSDIWYRGNTSSKMQFDQTTPGSTNVVKNIKLGETFGVDDALAASDENPLNLTIENNLNITGTADFIAGHLISNGNVTFKSNATTTAFVGPITDLTYCGIIGGVTVERYIPAGSNNGVDGNLGRAYRGLSSSVTGGTIFSNWQENGSVATLTGSILGNTLTTTINPTTPLVVGQHISGDLIPANTTIANIDNAASNQYEISTVQNSVSRAYVAYTSISTATIKARFTGSISGNELTVTAFSSGNGLLAIGQKIAPALPNTVITAFVTGTGGVGTYTIGLEIPSQVIHYNGAPVGFGTHVTGIVGTDAQLGQNDGDGTGLDYTRSGNPSLYTYSNSSQVFGQVMSTKATNLVAGTPYLIAIRGDRTIDLALNNTPPTNTTLRSTGEIVAGPIDVTLTLNTTTSSFNFVGNPYQSPVDLSLIYADSARWADLGQSYTVFDSKINSRGAYVTFDFDPLIGSTNSTSVMDAILEPNQAFFVTTTGATPTLVFNESDKNVSSNAYNAMFRNTQSTTPKIKGSICNASTNKTLDGFIIAFSDTYNNSIIAEDTRKPSGNQDETFASTNDVTKMAIDKRNFPSEADEIPLSITQYRLTDYILKFNVSNFDQMDAYLVDTYTATETTLNNNEINSYSFTVDTSIPASIAENRFKIVFRNSALQTNSNSINTFAVYPNPVVDNKFTIKSNQAFSGKDANVNIINSLGQKVFSFNGAFSTDGSLLVNPTVALSKGIYLVKVAVEGKVETKKLIIK